MSRNESQTESVTMDAPAKLNLYLRILGRRGDGYHELDTLFFRLEEPCDTLTFTPGAPGSGCRIDCPIPGLASEDNLAHKAWTAYGRATGFLPDLCIAIDKRIPSGAGLGGGSTDAATVLRYLNTRAGKAALGDDALIALAAGLGADVPFFLLDTPARATGIGEKLTSEQVDFSGLTLVVACPEEHVNTAWAYRTFDAHAKTGGTALTTARADNIRPVPKPLAMFHNDFESVVFQAFPSIRAVKEELIRLEASAAAMSGSGASVFAVFRNEGQARKAAETLAEKQVRTYTRRY